MYFQIFEAPEGDMYRSMLSIIKSTWLPRCIDDRLYDLFEFWIKFILKLDSECVGLSPSPSCTASLHAFHKRTHLEAGQIKARNVIG